MYKKEIMSDVRWGFYENKYDSFEQFIREVIEYNKDLDLEWIPDATVLVCQDVIIQYSYWDDDIKTVIEKDFELIADNQTDFTAGELLFKIHNQVVDRLKNEDFNIFQGLALLKKDCCTNLDKPHYFIEQGALSFLGENTGGCF